MRHPLYCGYGIQLAGYFIFTGSASGLWMVTPLVILAMTALVLGYENIDLKQRFPGQAVKSFLDLPENSGDKPDMRDRLSASFLVLMFLFISNFVVDKLTGASTPLYGKPMNLLIGIDTHKFSLLSVAFLLTIPFLLKRKDEIRRWEIASLLSLFYLVFIALQYPAVGAQYLPAQEPSLFTVPAFMLLITLSAMNRQPLWKYLLSAIIAGALLIIHLSISRSAPLNLAVSVFIYLVSFYYQEIWLFLRIVTEIIANSWKEWEFGKVRIINHGFYAGLGTALSLFISGVLAGRNYALALMVGCMVLIICAALWAQVIEGSPKLKRPFGYYGSVFGLVLASGVIWLFGLNPWVALAVASVSMPWGQAVGRLRCLVNGCCHGCRTESSFLGIRFHHPRSRVHNISGLQGELIHPTQLYSIIWLFFVGIVLFTLWVSHCSYTLILGLYLILTSSGRFVEEAFRGEAQTPVISGLRLYQWVAIVVLITGIGISMIRVEPVFIDPGFGWETILFSATGGLFAMFAMGVDFPYSNARFSRLV